MKIRIVEYEKKGKAIATIDNAQYAEIKDGVLKIRYFDEDKEYNEVTGSIPEEITITE